MTLYEQIKAANELARAKWPEIRRIGEEEAPRAWDTGTSFRTGLELGTALDAKITEELGQTLGEAVYDWMEGE